MTFFHLTLENARNLAQNLRRLFFYLEVAWKIFLETFFWRTLASCVLGPWPWLRAFLPWPQDGLSSRSRFLALDFFVSLALVSNVVSLTPPLIFEVLYMRSYKNAARIFDWEGGCIFRHTTTTMLKGGLNQTIK